MPLPACFEVRNSVADCQANSMNHLPQPIWFFLVYLSQPSAPSLPNWTTKTNSWPFCFKSFLLSVSHTWVKLWFAVHNHTTVSPTLPPPLALLLAWFGCALHQINEQERHFITKLRLGLFISFSHWCHSSFPLACLQSVCLFTCVCTFRHVLGRACLNNGY